MTFESFSNENGTDNFLDAWLIPILKSEIVKSNHRFVHFGNYGEDWISTIFRKDILPQYLRSTYIFWILRGHFSKQTCFEKMSIYDNFRAILSTCWEKNCLVKMVTKMPTLAKICDIFGRFGPLPLTWAEPAVDMLWANICHSFWHIRIDLERSNKLLILYL